MPRSSNTTDSNEQYVALYRQHYPYLFKTGQNAGFAPDIIKDLINQTFLAFIEKHIDWSQIDQPKFYIASSFKNKLTDYARSKGKTYTIPDTETTDDSIEEKIILTEEAEQLKAQMQQAYLALPPRCRLVIRLKYYEGLTHDQIAAQTGLSHRSIYNNLSEGLKAMRLLLADKPQRPGQLLSLLALCIV
ncbi:MAG: sigma-70 family RNA polymerase sigma factor [Chitinophaga sp.]|uniref:RNA polymerase sigma factor n=1 Tax=Chitinophaga sp. TaxID=1869181 RepID=UPI001B18E9A6|nr:sigma-70 family RNA polymerase sigma factor [Chitinophaga sp.]MBO9727259.1 sigma-70 family RNA polymerase sigma factor [Chitinophaga sp.]